MNTKNEFRKHPRIAPQRTVAVTVAVDSGIKLGLLTDISAGGLGIRYIGENGVKSFNPNESCTLSLLESDGQILMENIPARVICEYCTPEIYSVGVTQMNKCCVQFEALPRHLDAQLDMTVLKIISEDRFSAETERLNQEVRIGFSLLDELD